MNTAICPIRAQHISRTALAELLGTAGPAYEALGAGVTQALDCLAHSREFYDLPQAIQPELDAFAMHLHQALAALERAERASGL